MWLKDEPSFKLNHQVPASASSLPTLPASPPLWELSKYWGACTVTEPSWAPAGPRWSSRSCEYPPTALHTRQHASTKSRCGPGPDTRPRPPCCQQSLAGPGLSLIYIQLGCVEKPPVAFGPGTLFSRKGLSHQHPFQGGSGPEGLAWLSHLPAV